MKNKQTKKMFSIRWIFCGLLFWDTSLHVVSAVRKKNISARDFSSWCIQEGFWFWVLLDIEVCTVSYVQHLTGILAPIFPSNRDTRVRMCLAVFQSYIFKDINFKLK